MRSHPFKANAAVGTEAPPRTNALFEQPWRPDAVAPGARGAVEVSRDDRVVARLPTVTEQFALEGSVIESVERFFRRFGETLRPHLRVTHFSRRMGFLMAGREMTKALLGDSEVPAKRA